MSQDVPGQEIWVYCGNGGYVVGVQEFLLAVYTEMMLLFLQAHSLSGDL